MRANFGVVWFLAGVLFVLIIEEKHIRGEVDRRVDLGQFAVRRSDDIKAGRHDKG